MRSVLMISALIMPMMIQSVGSCAMEYLAEIHGRISGKAVVIPAGCGTCRDIR